MLLRRIASRPGIAMPTPQAFTTILSLMAIFSRCAFGIWTITCSEKRPDLPVTTPRAPLPSPVITMAVLPTQAKMLRPRFPRSLGNAMLMPGWMQSAIQP